MKKVTILVGNIASGKSTWIQSNIGCNLNNIISKDNLRKFFSETVNEKYIWDDFLEKLIHNMVFNFYEGMLFLGTKHIIIDETNMDIKTRKPYIDLSKLYEYYTEAIVFPDMGWEVHVNRRIQANHGSGNVSYWKPIYQRKKGIYECPTIGEGFDEITFI